MSLIFSFTIGSIGKFGRVFIENLSQADFRNVLNAFLGGIIFNAANILVVAAIAIAGMSVAFPIGIGIALVLGVVINYMAAPYGNAYWLFLGVFLVTVAIILDGLIYRIKTSRYRRFLRKDLYYPYQAAY